MNFFRVKKNYDNNLWSKKMVADAVKSKVITAEEYYVIVGEEYKEEQDV